MALLRMRRPPHAAILLFLICIVLYAYGPFQERKLSSFPLSHNGRIQDSFYGTQRGGQRVEKERMQAVKEEFQHSWKGYKSRAWMFDELRPVSGGNYTKLCGWAATLVDSLDTLHIMGLEDEWKEAVDAVLTLDFATLSWSCNVNVFEMTIRHLGGMIAAYDIDGSRDKRLLDKSVEVGEMLFNAFNTTNGLQCSFFEWPKNPQYGCPLTKHMPLAGLGSLNLEFIRLSIITDNPKYADAIGHVASEMARTQDDTSVPGLWPTTVDTSCAEGLCELTSNKYSLGESGDSTFEYVLKSHLLFGAKNSSYASMWEKAVLPIKQHMLYKPMTIDNQDILFAGMLIADIPSGVTLDPETQHLQCFLGGLFALSAKAFKRPEDLEIAAKLTDGCVWAYRSTPSGIMPETFYAFYCDDHTDCPWNESRWQKEVSPLTELPYGFSSIRDGRYLLRPEAIESVFIMYRVTGDRKWRDKGWKMFTSIRNATRTAYGHSAINDVFSPSPLQTDEMESFWLAETLKYFYLLFADPGLVSLDDWVLNTEAHPIKLEEGTRGF